MVQRLQCTLWAMFQCRLLSVLLYAASVLLLLVWQTQAALFVAAGLATLGSGLFLTKTLLRHR